MSQAERCRGWLMWYRKFSDRANTIESRLFRERQAVQAKEEEVKDLEGKLRIAEAQAQTFAGAGLVFGPIGSGVVTGIARTAFETRIARVREDLIPARSDLQRAREHLHEMERELENQRGLAQQKLQEMEDGGCALP